jgi:hypothetical protein
MEIILLLMTIFEEFVWRIYGRGEKLSWGMGWGLKGY